MVTKQKCYKKTLTVELTKSKLEMCIKTFEEVLWASQSHASSKPVADAMETWTKQMGYPVLFVTAKQVCVYQYFALDLFSARGFPLITRE